MTVTFAPQVRIAPIAGYAELKGGMEEEEPLLSADITFNIRVLPFRPLSPCVL